MHIARHSKSSDLRINVLLSIEWSWWPQLLRKRPQWPDWLSLVTSCNIDGTVGWIILLPWLQKWCNQVVTIDARWSANPTNSSVLMFQTTNSVPDCDTAFGISQHGSHHFVCDSAIKWSAWISVYTVRWVRVVAFVSSCCSWLLSVHAARQYDRQPSSLSVSLLLRRCIGGEHQAADCMHHTGSPTVDWSPVGN